MTDEQWKLTPKNWEKFQHYKDRAPAWIKLHRGLLDDYQFHCLPVASRALAPCIWLLAAEYDKGEICASPAQIAYRLHYSVDDLIDAIKPLIDGGFLTSASDVLAARYQRASPEERRGQVKTEEREEGKTPQKGFSPLLQEEPLPSALEGKEKNGPARSLAALPAGALSREPDSEPAERKQVADKKPATLAEINELWRANGGFGR